MQFVEEARYFDCAGEWLLGLLARPEQPADTAVLILVGGPQYRVGSHRQFLLLSRTLAAAGYPCLRFDFRGMGDSSGEAQSFEDGAEDIAAAIEALQAVLPSIRKVVLWGLCDAASAALLYWQASGDRRLAGLALLNPWVRSEATLARTQLRHYYVQRLLAGEFWGKLGRGQFEWRGATREFLGKFRQARGAGQSEPPGDVPFQQRMTSALRSFPGPVLLVLSGNDLTAREFLDCAAGDPGWSGILGQSNITRCDVAGADHTFSTAAWRQEVEQATLGWLNALQAKP